MDDGRFVVDYSNFGHTGSAGTLDRLSNGVIHQSQLVPTASYATQPAAYTSQTGLGYAPDTSINAPQLQIGYGTPLIQPQSQQFGQQQMYYGGQATQQTTGVIQSNVTSNPLLMYSANQQQQSVYHEAIGNTQSGETTGYFKSTIPTASGTLTSAVDSVKETTLNDDTVPIATKEPEGNNIVSIKVDNFEYNNVTVTDVSDLSSNIQTAVDIHQADLTSTETPTVTSRKTTKQGVRQKVKQQGVAQKAKTAETVTKQTVDASKVVKKKTVVPKQTVNISNVNKKVKSQVLEEDIDDGVDEKDAKPIRRKPKTKTQVSLVSDPFVEHVQSARAAQMKAKVPPKKKGKVIKRSQVSEESQTPVLEEPMPDERPPSRVTPLVEPAPAGSKQRRNRAQGSVQDPPELVPASVSEHTHTRVRVVHVTEDGTLSIRHVDKHKKSSNKNYKSQTSSIQTQTDTDLELTYQPEIKEMSVQNVQSVSKSMSTGQTQTDSSLHSVAAKRINQNPESIVQEIRTSHMEECSTEQVTWTAGARQVMDKSTQGAVNGTDDSEDGSSSENDDDDRRERKPRKSENIYATVIKPLGQERVMLEEYSEPEPATPPPIPNKSKQAFEPVYGNNIITEQDVNDDANGEESHTTELSVSEIRACEDINASLEGLEDPYATIPDISEVSINTASAHGTVSSSGTNVTDHSSSGSSDNDSKEPESYRIRRLAKEKRQRGEVDVYENISIRDDGEMVSPDDRITVESADVKPKTDDVKPKTDDVGSKQDGSARNSVNGMSAAQNGITDVQPVGDTLPKAKLPISLPLGFRLNDSFNVYFHCCDIAKIKTDVIVNAANGKLKHDNGVAKAIAKVAGKDLEQDSKKHVKKNGQVEVGDVVSTKPGKLQCAYVFHAVGPKYKDFKDKNACMNKLRETYDKVLELCLRHKVPSVAIPPISAGKFGVPNQFISACIHETLLAAAINPKCEYMKIIHLVNMEPTIILPVAEALATRPSLIRGTPVKVELIDRRDVRRTLAQFVERKKSSSSSKYSKSSDGKSRSDKSRDAKTTDDSSRDGKSRSAKSSSGSNNSSQKTS